MPESTRRAFVQTAAATAAAFIAQPARRLAAAHLENVMIRLDPALLLRIPVRYAYRRALSGSAYLSVSTVKVNAYNNTSSVWAIQQAFQGTRAPGSAPREGFLAGPFGRLRRQPQQSRH
jgi:hypothetical protein